MRRHLLTLSAALFLAAPTLAQEQGTLSIGAYASAAFMDEATTLSTPLNGGFGGYLSIFLLDNISLEGDVGYHDNPVAATGQDAGWLPIRGRLVLNIPGTETFYPLLGVGYTRQRYTGALGDVGDNAFSGYIGFKNYVSDRWAFRMDLRVDHVVEPFNASADLGEHTNWSATAGFQLDVLGGRIGDSDGDGVRDDRDDCPNTPDGVSVTSNGCRIDSDGDRVWDEDDECADTPRGARVDAAGCRLDSDGDGVYDEDDRCANTPAGTEVDARGCPVPVDSDGDGVYDDDDRCANTPRGTQVDARGCPVLFEAEGTALVLEGVTFETSSANLAGESRAILDRVAESLRANPEVRVRVEGHTDNTGSRAFNVQLSQQRAESVVAYLVSQGVSAGQLEARGVGPDEPIADNGTREGRARNRRVELERIGG
jgi:OOP family OmpA-OmpF porin